MDSNLSSAPPDQPLREPSEGEVRAARDALAALAADADALGPTPAAAPVHAEMGRIWFEQLGDERSAALCFQNAFALDPSERSNLEAARQLFAGAGRLDRAAALSAREEALARDSTERVQILRVRAALFADAGRPEEAAQVLETAAAELPDHPALLLDAADACAAAGRGAQAGALLARAARATSDDALRAALLKEALLHSVAAGAPDRELAAALGALDPGEPLVELALVRAARAGGDLAPLVKAAREKAGKSGEPADFVAAVSLSAFGAGKLEEARAEVEAALRQLPDDPALRALRLELAEAVRAPELPRLLQEEAARSQEPTERAQHRLRAAELSADEGERASLLGEALADDPSDSLAQALHARALGQRDPAGAARRFAAQAEAAEGRDEAEAARLFLEAGAWQERAGDREAAAELARRALHLVPRHAGALRMLVRTLPRLGQAVELVDLVEAAVEHLERPIAAELLARAAVLLMDAPDAPASRERALDLARRAAELARGLTTARFLESWSMLAYRNGDLGQLSQALEARADCGGGPDAAELLIEASELARAVGDFLRSDVLLRKARGVNPSSAEARAALLALPTLPTLPDPDRAQLLAEHARSVGPELAGQLHAERAALLEKEGRLDEAVQASAQALALSGAVPGVLRRLVRVQLLRGDAAAAAAAAGQLAESAPPGQARAAAFRRAAELAEHRAADPARAAELARKAAAEAPHDAQVQARAALALAAAERWAEAAAAVESTPSFPARHRWAAALWRLAGEPARAVPHAREDGGGTSARLALAFALESAGDRAAGARVAASLGDEVRDDAAAAALLDRAAAILARSGEPDAAQDALRRALSRDPGDLRAREALETSLRRSGDVAGLSNLLAERARREEGESAAALLTRRAQMLGAAGREEEAREAANDALRLAPAHAGAARLLQRLGVAGRAAQPSAPAAAQVPPAPRAAEADPLDPASLRATVASLAAAGNRERSLAVTGLLVALGHATAEERDRHAEWAAKPPPPELPHLRARDDFRAPGDAGPLRALLFAAAPELARAFPAELGGRAALVKGDNPVRRVVAALARAVGVSDPALYLARLDPAVVAPVAADPPGLLVGAEVPKRFAPRQQRFLYARALAHLKVGTQAVAGFPPERIARLLVELVRLCAPGASAALPGRDDGLADALARGLDAQARARLHPAAAEAAAVVAGQGVEVGRAVHETANRIGLVFCGDPAAAFALLAPEGEGGVERPATLELARFALELALRRAPAAAH